MFKVIEYDSSGSYNDVSEKYVSIDNLKDLKVKLFDDYIDIESNKFTPTLTFSSKEGIQCFSTAVNTESYFDIIAIPLLI